MYPRESLQVCSPCIALGIHMRTPQIPHCSHWGSTCDSTCRPSLFPEIYALFSESFSTRLTTQDREIQIQLDDPDLVKILTAEQDQVFR